MPAYNGVSAAINIDGKPLDEYQVQVNDAEKEISCWIPSQVGKEFTISCESSYSDKHILVEVGIDGSDGDSWNLPPKRQLRIKGCETSLTTEQAFVFSEGRLVDDDDIEGEIPDLHNLGTITLLLREGRITGELEEVTFIHTIPEHRQIPERGKKGVQTCIGLGAVRCKKPGKRSDVECLGDIARIVFRYRSLEYLRAQGIAPLPLPPPEPQPASPDPSGAPTTNEAKRKRINSAEPQTMPSKARRTPVECKKSADIESSDDEVIKELQAIRAQIDKVLAKKNARVKKKIKTEQAAVSIKDEVEVIDLT